MKFAKYFYSKNVVLDGSVKACPGLCAAEKVSDYCEAILPTEGLCPSGLRCCVSPDSNDDKLPPNLIIPNMTKNHTRITGHTPTQSSTLTTTESNHKTQFVSNPTVIKQKHCLGDCVSGFFGLFCEDIDTEAYCPGDGTCCVAPVSLAI